MHFAAGKRGVRGLTVIEVLVVIFVLVVLGGLILPATNGARPCKTEVRCANNLKNVGLAFRIFASDNNDRFPFELSVNDGGTRELHASGQPFHTFKVLSNELSAPKITICPQDKQKKASESWTNFTDANLSYFLNIAVQSPNATNRDFVTTTRDAEKPTDWLSGDRNLLINGLHVSPGRWPIPTGKSAAFDKDFHGAWGNLLRADGSVEQMSGKRLLSETNHEPYLLLIP
jgi:competence protein ComGC